MPLIIGLTGGIGCGKSTALQFFQTLGASAISADAINSQLLTHPKIINAIRLLLGDTVILSDGSVDKAAILRIISHDDVLKQHYESLLHPQIIKAIQQFITDCPSPYCIIEIPLLFETQSQGLVNRVLVIECDEALQIARVQARSGLSETEIKTLMTHQVSRKIRRQGADDIIENTGDVSRLRQEVLHLHHYYLTLADHD